ncbi:hypothetical protein PEM37_30590 [Streptomyces sp. AD681]|uniref:hypothetical protein n=1 Tax=Streptomyces sp. AD681 TaxID=3019069 RepID=UPI0022F1698B|nr:hypothetical protein [Streptomyces sp. AD681]MDA5145868.1 hypothetical protein [Streptomyces sp. AD681]
MCTENADQKRLTRFFSIRVKVLPMSTFRYLGIGFTMVIHAPSQIYYGSSLFTACSTSRENHPDRARTCYGNAKNYREVSGHTSRPSPLQIGLVTVLHRICTKPSADPSARLTACTLKSINKRPSECKRRDTAIFIESHLKRAVITDHCTTDQVLRNVMGTQGINHQKHIAPQYNFTVGDPSADTRESKIYRYTLPAGPKSTH